MNYRKAISTILLLLLSTIGQAETIEVTVNGLVCGFCAQGIEKRLRRFPATVDVLVSLEQRLVAVSLNADTDISDANLTEALEGAGYAVKAIRRTETPIAVLREQVKAGRR
ncbi:MAG: heavy-metal-associated domain-containing protein [Chromatiales bacterium]|nr:heavy-metal-associated domain-containing protein [Chromatiales bacterium]